MMNIEETTKKVDLLLQDRGLTSEYQEQAVRQLLYHLFVAIDIYRYMTFAEKAKAGYWYRMFKGSFSLRNFLKERKRTRERKNPPCTPLIKKGGVEKGQKTTHTSRAREGLSLEERKKRFWSELEQYVGKYDREMVLRFYYYWAEEMQGLGQMRWEIQKSWNISYRLAIWSKRSFENNDQLAAIRLTKAKKGQAAPSGESQTAKKVGTIDAHVVRPGDIRNAKKDASKISLEEYLKSNPNSVLARYQK